MIKISNKRDCCGCTACASACPKKCITMTADNEGYFYPVVDDMVCVECGLCEKVCPTLNKAEFDSFGPLAYAVQHKDETVRRQSSSGGAFSAFADAIIEAGGVVYGSAFDGDFGVCHTRVDNKADLAKFRGSKYVQSDMCDCYQLVKNDLKHGVKVLFSGTPCQVAGLVNFLGGIYPSNNLFLVDLVCHGIPSPLLWKKFIAKLSDKHGKLVYVSFRDKHFGYAGSTMAMQFENGKVKYLDRDIQFFKKLFFDDINTRPSCFDCRFKTIKRVSDLTIYDCWHVNEFAASMDDDKGATWVLLQSEKGQALFEQIKPYVLSVEAPIEKAIELDGELAINCTTPNPRRDEFFIDAERMTFDALIEKYFPMTFKQRMVNILKPLLGATGLIKILKRYK